MRVTLLHHTQLPVKGYGGTERVVVALARGLAELGHRVTLIAPTGTAVSGADVVPLPARAIRDAAFDPTPFVPAGTDILHAFFPLASRPALPWVWTLEGTTRTGVVRPANTIYVSRDHAARHGSASFVYNGLDPADLHYRDSKDDYDLFLGRLHQSKGYHWAIEGARAAGRRLIVAGGWRPTLSRQVRFVGEVHGERKAELLAGARLLWMPALWDEPFGLTLIEALWSGTPVLATRRGALPEVLGPEVAEFGDTVEQLVARLPAMAGKDPAACRARAERYFSHLRMAGEYLRCYRAYLDRGLLPEGAATDG
ncbi:MAG: glycosyltransferase [Gemmatimonadota bacterium]|nr:glycosyltransferase [Gemmatimonadota bacterium]MDH5284155.1 glycosyltransferase [Gemmatimonadota bacterium]